MQGSGENLKNTTGNRSGLTVLKAALGSSSMAAILAAALAAPAMAQPAPDPSRTSGDQIESVVVTGTHIMSAGFTAPTPTQTIGIEQIEQSAQPDLFTTIAQLPSLMGSSGTNVNTFSTSSGQQGLSSFSLRGLGTIRTLTLLDGQRVVGANVTGVPDISLFPQMLVQRVDVVTGGASASYGSDAVGGVVNFITDKHYEGFKANAEGGITTYGDDAQYLLQAAAGQSFLGGRLHVEAEGDYDHEDGVPAGQFGTNAANGRQWFHAPTLANTGITNNGKPQYVYITNAQATGYSKYGLITSGPLSGTAFDASGNPVPFVYGSGNNLSNCYVGFCVGGDNSGAVGIGASLQSGLKRLDGYTRIGYDLDDNNEIYATINMARVTSNNQPNPGASKSGLTVSCSNPYLPQSITNACATDNITSFKYGVDNAMLPNIHVDTDRRQMRFVLGADGTFDMGGGDWHYDAYYEHGEEITNVRVHNILLTPRYNDAINAVLLNGQIVCADATARANGCEPLDIFGDATPSAAALAYIEPSNGPFQHTHQQQDVASFSVSGQPVTLWAGPLDVAFGGEYRRENYTVFADAYGNGVSAQSPNDAAYPTDPVLSTAGSNWYAGNYHDGNGTYDVKEAFIETNLPLFDTEALGKANFNAAGRWTQYSTSGTVYAWKLGGTWETPWDGLRFRLVTSQDVRAPNLSELYAAPTTTTLPSFTDPFNNTSITVLQNNVGNPLLHPEIARNLEAGIVLNSPSWLPGFSASLDYYAITLNGGVSSLSAQQIVNFCYAGIDAAQTCGAFNFNPPSPQLPYVNVESFNLAKITTEGFDLEASYQFALDELPGDFTVHGLATNVGDYTTYSGIPGTLPTQGAGVNTGATPHWKGLMIESWNGDKASFSVTERFVSSGTFGYQYVVCQSSCPVSTGNNPTINYNQMAGAFYVDVGGSYDISDQAQAYFKIDNLLDRDPAPSPQTNTGLDTNPALYDIIGRTYRIGVRFKM